MSVPVASTRTVREAFFDVLRANRLTTLFANPGSTEVPLLVDLPSDLRFVLALHESSVVGMATGWGIGSGEPALVLLHTTAGLGNAVAAIATARVNRAPLVIVIGQQDRRHLAQQPFLAGQLDGLAGDYPVSVEHPALAQDVPGAVARAANQAVTWRGPALVIVPMDDWLGEPATTLPAAPVRMLRPAACDQTTVAELAVFLAAADTAALVVGAGADDPATWAALTGLAEHYDLPVFQEAFGGRAGFPQDHPRFAGHLPPERRSLRRTLAPYDTVMVIGAAAFRQNLFDEGDLLEEGTRLLVLTDDPDEAHRSPADLAVLGSPAAVCAALAQRLPARAPSEPVRAVTPPLAPSADGHLQAEHVFDALAARLPSDVILVEESPSSRPALQARLPARDNLGYVSAAMGGLGFGMPASVGLKMACPHRPVVALIGDGSSLYAFQAAWSAARYGVGTLIIILVNGRYAVMDSLAERAGAPGPWPGFAEVHVEQLAAGLGCPALTVDGQAELEAALDEIVPGLAARTTPLVMAVTVH
jgi:benzoylformate decarboxylase